jgi:S1-C subfamily serine protease
MKQLVLLLALTAPVLGGAPPTPFPQQIKGSPPPDYIVRIYVEEDRARSAGSGALILNNVVITCNHVVKDSKDGQIEVMFTNWDVVLGKVTAVDKDYDLALITLNVPRKELPARFGPAPSVGDTLTIQGFGYGPYLAQTGTYKSIDKTEKWGIIKGAQARSGDSGGPVIKDGRFVGVLWGASENHTWFTPIDKIINAFALTPPEDVKPVVPYIINYDL